MNIFYSSNVNRRRRGGYNYPVLLDEFPWKNQFWKAHSHAEFDRQAMVFKVSPLFLGEIVLKRTDVALPAFVESNNKDVSILQ